MISVEPPWTPCPDIDPEYEGLAPEEWNKVPVFPDRFASEWSDALLVNRLDDATPLVEAALSSRGVGLGADATVWPRLLRLALVVAARAHSINARREQGDYRDGFPQSADLPLAQVPGDFAPAEPVADQTRPGTMPPAARASEPHVRTPRLSESFAEYLADPQVIGPNGDPKAIKQAKLALDKFTQLIGDLPIGDISGDVVEEFKAQMRRLPGGHGKGLYSKKGFHESIAIAERLRSQIANSPGSIELNGEPWELEDAQDAAWPILMRTINRDISIFSMWARWILRRPSRSHMLAESRNPFQGRSYPKKVVHRDSEAKGSARREFTSGELRRLLAMPDIQEPPMLAPSNDIDVQLAQAKFWCVLIALYTGMRLNEIAKLRPADFQVEHGIALINLTILPGRTFKTPQSARRVPLHRDLIDLGLPEFAAAVARTNHKSLLPSVVYSEVSYQCGANISKWFLRFRRAAGVSDPNTPFHSFRNTFITAMRSQCSGGDILVDQIVGHKPSGVNAEYTGIISLARKSAEINAVHYDV